MRAPSGRQPLMLVHAVLIGLVHGRGTTQCEQPLDGFTLLLPDPLETAATVLARMQITPKRPVWRVSSVDPVLTRMLFHDICF